VSVRSSTAGGKIFSSSYKIEANNRTRRKKEHQVGKNRQEG
jgi:hypothetical protein